MTEPMTPRDDLRALATQVECAHDNRTGGNDYILCHDCGLVWDYRQPGWHGLEGARRALAANIRALAAVQETPQDHEMAEQHRRLCLAGDEPGVWPCGCRVRIVDSYGTRELLPDACEFHAQETPAARPAKVCASCGVPALHPKDECCRDCFSTTFMADPGGPTR